MGDKYKLMQDYNLTEDMLKIRCSKEHIYKIEQFISWKEVGRHLPKIGSVELSDMDVDSRTEPQRRERLMALWEERNANEATYDVLIDAMIKAQKLDEATEVCKLLRPDRPPPPKPPSSDIQPPNINNITEFKKRNGEMINILIKIGADYHQFGLKLLADNDGNIMDDIIENFNGNSGKIKRQIVIDWVNGKGKGKKPITWETLAEVVSKMGLAVLAKDIREATC